jgi:hypothetical protein
MYVMLNPAARVVNNSRIEGAGLVAGREIPAGEVIFHYDTTQPPVHLHELVHWPRQKRVRFFNFAIQLGEDEWCFRQGEIKFMNHSCDPNVWWEGYGTLVARRPIGAGEELTFDYSTSEITLTWNMECRCGSTACRGVASNRDYLDAEFQRRYAGHLPAHVMEAIRQSKLDAAGFGRNKAKRLPGHLAEAIREARLSEAEFREKYGDQYVFEMVRQLILRK